MDATGLKLSLNKYRPRKPPSKFVHEFDLNGKFKILFEISAVA